ncbi:MAG: 50S ribosomal protein L6 [Candidatus Thermoplasmatota archaeon]|nr:50S ribosomal protein L6 [Candidatus Thermoplasmatota archaeon]MCL5962991.1 50S ribosomal protein L6 [Candidatus Thermoplasmatota archaeon]
MVKEIKKEEYTIPGNLKTSFVNNILSIQGSEGMVTKRFFHTRIIMTLEGNKIIISYLPVNRKIFAIVNCWKMHFNNMVLGVTKGWKYRMKMVYAHFPVKLTFKDDSLHIDNFLGEKSPRIAHIPAGVKVRIEDNSIILEGPDIEKIGMAASVIEKTTKIKRYDPRVFQDGIYIISKGEYIQGD